MAAVLLVAFPILLLFNPRLAAVALVVAIVILVSKRFGTARRIARDRVDSDASI